MKVGIISMQRVINYGSFLQAYALKKLIEANGHTVHFVDIEKNPEHKGEPRIKNYYDKLRRIDRHIITRFRHKKLSNYLFQIFPEYQKKFLGFDERINTSDECEGIVIGSDEIFNCESGGHWKVTSERFGKITGAKRTISYAASCGYTNLDNTNEADRKLIEEGMRCLDKVSVRDNNSKQFAENFCSNVECHLDPVLIYDYEEEVIAGENEGVPKEEYMLIYAYTNRINRASEIKAIKAYAKKHNLKIIAVGGSQAWCEEYAVISPFQVLAYFKNAQCVISDTFHGTVMAAKYNKPMGVFVRPNNQNKLEDLLCRLHIENYAVRDPANLEAVLNGEQDFSLCNQTLASEKLRSKQYICDSLKLQ